MKLGRFLIALMRPLFWLLFPYKVIGRENIPPEENGQRTVLCCNHISLIDPVYLLMGQRRHIYFMGKEELFRSRFGRWFLGRQMGVFAVARGKGDRNAISQAEQIVKEGKIMGIFPEGTRSKDGKLGRMKSGAALILAQTGAQMLPACVITKHQKVRLFRRTTVVFGMPLTGEELHLVGEEKPDLRYASRKIQETIGQMMEEHS